MSLFHDATTPLSDIHTHQACMSKTDLDVGFDHDCIRANAVHLADLGYPATAIEDYQVQAAQGRINRHCHPDSNTIIPEHLWSQMSPDL